MGDKWSALIPPPDGVPDWASVGPDDEVACGIAHTYDGEEVTVELTADLSALRAAFDRAYEAAVKVAAAHRHQAADPERWTAARELAGR